MGKVATPPLPSQGSPPLQSGGQNQKWPTCGQSGYVTPAVSGIPTASERGVKSEVAHLWAKWLRHPCRLGDPHHFRLFGCGIDLFIHTFFENSFCQTMHFPETKRQCSGGKGETAKYNFSIAYFVKDAPGCYPCVARVLSGGQNQKWPTCGQSGYLTPPVSGIPTAAERGAKSELAHLWAKWLRHPCRRGDPHHLRAGSKIRSGARKRAELLCNSCFLGDPPKRGIDMAHVGPGQKGL